MALRNQLLGTLADGRFHSGVELGRVLGVSRAAVWKHLRALDRWGIEVFAVPGRGYRLAEPLELLDHEKILEALDSAATVALRALDIHPVIDSTNRYLVEQTRAQMEPGRACLAEMQTAGRGRRGRQWVSPFGASVYLSVSWRFACSPTALGALSLAAGVTVARTLDELGAEGVQLKWPNDLVWGGRKLGGVLVELAGEAAGPCHVVIGVGINAGMPERSGAGIDQPWTDLAAVCGRGTISRNRLAGRLINHLLDAMCRYEAAGAGPFLKEWRNRDALRGRPVAVQVAGRTVEGVAVGIDGQGALLVDTGMERLCLTSGEVSVRVRP